MNPFRMILAMRRELVGASNVVTTAVKDYVFIGKKSRYSIFKDMDEKIEELKRVKGGEKDIEKIEKNKEDMEKLLKQNWFDSVVKKRSRDAELKVHKEEYKLPSGSDEDIYMGFIVWFMDKGYKLFYESLAATFEVKEKSPAELQEEECRQTTRRH